MTKQSYGKNIEVEQTKTHTIITMANTPAKEEPFGRSKSGKTITLGTTSGNIKLPDDSVLGVNWYRYPEEK